MVDGAAEVSQDMLDEIRVQIVWSLVTGNEERWLVPRSGNFVPKRGTGTIGNTPGNARGTPFITDRNAYLEEAAPPRCRRPAAALGRRNVRPRLRAGTLRRSTAALRRPSALGRCAEPLSTASSSNRPWKRKGKRNQLTTRGRGRGRGIDRPLVEEEAEEESTG